MEIYSSSFDQNTADYLLQTKFYNILIQDTIFNDNECSKYCISNLDSALTINSSIIPSNQPSFIEFGHEFKSEEEYYIEYFNSSCSTNGCESIAQNYEIGSTPLCFYHMDAFDTTIQFTLVNFGPENGSISYLPCAELDLSLFPSSVFSQKYPSIIPTTVFAESNGLLLEDYRCPYLNLTTNATNRAYTESPALLQSLDECHIECIASVSCFKSHFILNATAQSTIKCTEEFACAFSKIHSTSPQFSIFCETDSACKGTFIHAENVKEFTMDCIVKESCAEMTVWLDNTISATIVCYELSVYAVPLQYIFINTNVCFAVQYIERIPVKD